MGINIKALVDEEVYVFNQVGQIIVKGKVTKIEIRTDNQIHYYVRLNARIGSNEMITTSFTDQYITKDFETALRTLGWR